MTQLVLPAGASAYTGRPDPANQQIEVMVHVQVQVLDPDVARRRANVWLGMNAGHLLMVENPELLLGDPIQWRFDVILSTPRRNQPGTATQQPIGQIRLNANTGEVIEPARLIPLLTTSAAALASR
jgi:hypothetical protein